MNSLQIVCEDRLKQILVKDKSENPNYILGVLKSDLLYLLKNYLDISAENLILDVFVMENGTYKIIIEGYAKRIKMAKHIDC